jgi:hypothetical protein
MALCRKGRVEWSGQRDGRVQSQPAGNRNGHGYAFFHKLNWRVHTAIPAQKQSPQTLE